MVEWNDERHHGVAAIEGVSGWLVLAASSGLTMVPLRISMSCQWWAALLLDLASLVVNQGWMNGEGCS